MAIVQITADLAPMPAMKRAAELLMGVKPVHEDVAQALQLLRRAYMQADIAASRQINDPRERQIIRGILGADVK